MYYFPLFCGLAGHFFSWSYLGSLTQLPSDDGSNSCQIQDGLTQITGNECWLMAEEPQLSSMWRLILQWARPTFLCGGRMATFQENKGGSLKASYSLVSGVLQHHFHHILLAKSSHKPRPDLEGGERDSTPWWAEQQSHITKGMVPETRGITAATFANNLQYPQDLKLLVVWGFCCSCSHHQHSINVAYY